MKNKYTIPLYQLMLFIIILILIGLRIILNNLNIYINLVNYISMIISISGVWISIITKSQESRNKNICKSIFIIFLSFFVIAGFLMLVLSIEIPVILNDIFTLIALWFCICNNIFEKIIKWIFSLEYLH